MIHKRQAGNPGDLCRSRNCGSSLFQDHEYRSAQSQLGGAHRLFNKQRTCIRAVYAALAKRGYFPEGDLNIGESWIAHLQGIRSSQYAGVDMNSGILRQGIQMERALHLPPVRRVEHHVYTLLGDGNPGWIGLGGSQYRR
jgi:transketolase